MLKRIIKSKIFKVILITLVVITGLIYHINPYRDTIAWNNVQTSLELTTEIEKIEALHDLEYIIDRISKYHVSTVNGLPEDIENQFEIEKENLPDSPNVLDVWSASSRIVSKLKDAHANVYYYGHDNLEIDIKIGMDKNKIVVKEGPRKAQQLIEVGGVPVEELFESFLLHFSYENIYFANYNFISYIKRRNQLNWLGLPVSDEVELAFDNNGNIEKEIYTFREIIHNEYNPNFIKYEIDKENEVGILVLNSCIYNDVYKNTLKEFFLEAKSNNIKAIALDLRENGGGNSMVANEFLRYLPVDSYKTYGSKVRLQSWIMDSKVKEVKNKAYTDLVFNGEIYILTSNTTFSSATMFTTFLRDNNLGMIIGEPSGNKPSAYGDLLLFQLPNSKLPLTLTYKYFSRPDITLDAEEAIMPDYPIEQEEALMEFYRLISTN